MIPIRPVPDDVAERLIKLIEECAEIQKAATKALRFGMDSNWDGRLEKTNRRQLEEELGHLMFTVGEMTFKKDISILHVNEHAENHEARFLSFSRFQK